MKSSLSELLEGQTAKERRVDRLKRDIRDLQAQKSKAVTGPLRVSYDRKIRKKLEQLARLEECQRRS